MGRVPARSWSLAEARVLLYIRTDTPAIPSRTGEPVLTHPPSLPPRPHHQSGSGGLGVAADGALSCRRVATRGVSWVSGQAPNTHLPSEGDSGAVCSGWSEKRKQSAERGLGRSLRPQSSLVAIVFLVSVGSTN